MAAPVVVAPDPEPAAEGEGGDREGPAAPPPPPARSSSKPRPAEPTPQVPRGTAGEQVVHLRLDELHPNPLQPRKGFDAEALEGLAASIRREGLIQPITVRMRPAGGYEIVAGERRYRAAGRVGMETIPALLRPLSDADTARWALIENLQREDLNPIERADALQRLCETQGLRHAEVGEAVGLSRPSVTNLLRLLSLCEPVRALVADGHLRMGHARTLAAVEEPTTQERIARACVEAGWSVRVLEREVRKAIAPGASNKQPPSPPPSQVRAAWLHDLESQLSSGLQTPVRVTPGRKRGTGTVTLEYRTLEDFDRLVERLGVRTG